MPSPREIVDTYQALNAQKGTLKNILQDIKTFVMPTRDEVTLSGMVPGTQNDTRTRLVSTAVQANTLLAASMAGSLTPPSFQWFNLQLREDDLMEIKSVRDWLEDCTKRQKKAYDASNFGVKIHETYLDLGAFGTAAVLQEEMPRDQFNQFQGIRFDIFPIADYCFLEGADGKPGGFYNCLRLRADQAQDLLQGKANYVGLGDAMTGALNASDPSKKQHKFEIIHAIIPNDKYNKNGKNKLGAMPYESIYVARQDKHTISSGGFEEFPLAIARWSQASADNGWGRGPGWTALAEIKTLNRIRELGLKALAKDVSPPLLVPHKGVIGGIKTKPNAINYYNPAKYNGAKPEYMTSGSRWDIAQFNIERIEGEIRSIFYADQLQLKESPAMTATEAQIRYELMQRLLGPTFWRLVSELFNPTIYRTFNIMLRGGAFKPVPDELRQYAQQRGEEPTLDVVYTGPLARAQRQEEVIAIQRAYELAGAVAQMTGSASVFDNLDDDIAIKEAAERLGVPGKIMRGADMRDGIRQQRAQAQAQAQQIEAENIQAQTAERAASAGAKAAAI